MYKNSMLIQVLTLKVFALEYNLCKSDLSLFKREFLPQTAKKINSPKLELI